MREYDRRTDPQGSYSIFSSQPWARFWARIIDIFIIDTIVRLTQLIFFTGSMFEPILLSMGTYFIWALAEAKLMSTWGTTPGKWLLKIKVRTNDLEIPDFKTALKRSILVWILGMGLGIFTTVSYIFGYYELTRRGNVPWDRTTGCSVEHEKMSENRRLAVVFIVIGLCIVSFSLALVNGFLYLAEFQGF
ncbi:RDD family protein [Acetivibrio mesophilus]|uniref:RDD family protein n=1 Tax=Acetivibrio mesophilus TaxID=2487273 RepID=A0A4Q0I3I1_9FIRM|nr:RDD family protein [Acetivibrio mesophilus]ODM25463.1 hypothetical protein A7W90_04040 [Clostridium sp. Bc-iso-3]RXE58307.1 RDD family protein [Acetivibrio mesophilus]HHV28863.1 RDD family protein [Clostridium sp.]